MELTGLNVIGGKRSGNGSTTFQGVNPADDQKLDPATTDSRTTSVGTSAINRFAGLCASRTPRTVSYLMSCRTAIR